ncbi:putative O-linked N-acetylglucosamine transferase, SPINDLY family [Bacteroidales bacterium Barb4]|nr:putative O-linked N-acetylglucosamine transferase, SPINDLY family [Bacteroidales bacterium Barb4]
MTIKEINKTCEHITDLLDNRALKGAFDALQGLIAGCMVYGEFQERLDGLQDTYRYLLRYRTDGVSDPQQEVIYHGLLTATYELSDIVKRRVKRTDSSTMPYQFRGVTKIEPDYEDLYKRIRSFTENTGNRVRYEAAVNDFFRRLWLSGLLTAGEAAVIRAVIADRTLHPSVGCQTVSGLFVGLQEAFDREKMNLLFDAALSDEAEVRVRAFVCIMVILYMYRKRVSLYPQVVARLEALADSDPDFTSLLLDITLRFILSRETEKITRRMQEELIPEMIKRGVKPGFNVLREDTPEQAEKGMNPEWNTFSMDSELGKKMAEFGELQQEGADVMHSTFCHLKSFSFFGDIGNWFLPFMPEHSALRPVVEDEVLSATPDRMAAAFFLCNSDKYSLLFSMKQMPAPARRVMAQQFGSEALDMLHQQKAGLNTRREKADIIARLYIQDLYRFYKLRPARNGLNDIFALTLDFHNLPLLRPYISDADSLRMLAEYYLHREYYADALSLFRQLAENDRENDILYQKTGFCLQRQDDLQGALEAYLHADLLNTQSQWVTRRIGDCYRSLKQPEKALPYYRRCETLSPDNLSVQMSLGHCCLETKNYEEALKYYFKVDYLDTKGSRAWRPAAWCSFLTGRYEQSLGYYRKIIAGTPAMQDYLNAGHAEWALQHIREALAYYRQSAETAGDFAKFRRQFERDIPALLLAGINEEEIPLMLDQLGYLLEGA